MINSLSLPSFSLAKEKHKELIRQHAVFVQVFTYFVLSSLTPLVVQSRRAPTRRGRYTKPCIVLTQVDFH